MGFKELLLGATLVCVVAVGNTIQCYNGNFMTVTDSSITVDCPLGTCKKIVQLMEGKAIGVSRTCATNCQPSESASSKTECCSGNFCNGGDGAVVKTTSGNKCYLCTDCGSDPFDEAKATLQPCLTGECMKRVLTYGVGTIINRQCNHHCVQADSGTYTGTASAGTKSYCCTGDRCNTGTVPAAGRAAMVLGVSVSAILVWFY